jgi:hypothetical protein
LYLSDEELKLIPAPEDDPDPAKMQQAILAITRKHEAELLYIADKLTIPFTTFNDHQRAIGYCYRANYQFWHAAGLDVSPADKRLQEECRIKMKRIDTALESLKWLNEAHRLGIAYRIERYQLGL